MADVYIIKPKHKGTGNLSITVGNYTETFPVEVGCYSGGTMSVNPTINSTTLRWTGSEQYLVTDTTQSNTSSFFLGWKKGSDATSDSQITWGGKNVKTLKATDVATYYIYKKYDNYGTEYCNANQTYTKVGTKEIKKALPTAAEDGWRCNGSQYIEYDPWEYQSIQLRIKNNSGSVTFPSSVTYSGPYSGSWSCNSSGVISIPANTHGGTYNVTATISIAADANGHYESGTKSITWSISIWPRIPDIAVCGYGPTDITSDYINITAQYPAEISFSIESGFCSGDIYLGDVPPTQSSLVWYESIASSSMVIPEIVDDIGTRTIYFCFVPTNTNDWTPWPGYPNSNALRVNMTLEKGTSGVSISTYKRTLYNTTGYNTISVSVSDYHGSVQVFSTNTSVARVYSFNSGSGTFIVEYVGNGTANIYVRDAGDNYYNGNKSNEITITCKTDTVVSYGNITGSMTFNQQTNFPAGGITLTTSNIGNYFNYNSTYTQTRIWESGYTSNDATISYAWSGTSVTIPSLGTTATSGTTARTISFTIVATGQGSKTKTASPGINSGNQAQNSLTGIAFAVDSSTISYGGSTTGTVTASYTSGSTKNVSNDTNTSYVDNSDPDIVSFTKNS